MQRRTPEYKSLLSALPNVLPADEVVDAWIIGNTIDYVSRDHDRPFFVWCGICGPHGPFDPPEPYAGMYPPDDVPVYATIRADMSTKPPFQQRSGARLRREPDDSLIRRLISARSCTTYGKTLRSCVISPAIPATARCSTTFACC